jgi:phosphohistidine swiveling domain-containing protein
MHTQLVESAKIVVGLAPITPSTSTPDRVSLKDYRRMTAIITVDNGNTVTGSAITLHQATTVAGGSEKALAFTKAYRNIDVDAADALAAFDVTSNTFTTDTTNAKNLLYVIEIDASELDTNNGFDCVRVGTGNGANMVLSVVYILHGGRYQGATLPTVITD